MDIADLIERREFERLFVDELGWDRLRARQSLSVVVPGQLTRGWLSVEERQRKASLQHHTYELVPVAQKRGQAVFEVLWRDSERMPDTVARLVVARQVVKTYYEPLLIFTSTGSESQVWLWAHRGDDGLEACEHHFSGDDRTRLPSCLEALRFGFEDEESLSVLSVQRRLRDAFYVVRQVRRLERRQIDTEAIRRRWGSLYRIAKIAAEHRGIDKDEERRLVVMGLDGNVEAKARLARAHMYLPIDQTLKRWDRAPLAGVDVPDLVQAGMIGLWRAVELYDLSQTPRFQTFASLWVRRSLDFAWRHAGRQIKIPNHVFDGLEKTAQGLETLFDRFAQTFGRCPTSDTELIQFLTADESTRQTLELMGAKFVSLDEASELASSDRRAGMATTLLTVSHPDEGIDLWSVENLLGELPPNQRDVLLLRFGLHPESYGDEMTLEQAAKVIQVSPERARLIQKKALDYLKLQASTQAEVKGL